MSDWQPIETAPRDESLMIVYGGYHDYAIVFWYTDGNRFAVIDQCIYSCDSDELDFDPTHWQPLPDPPEGDEV